MNLPSSETVYENRLLTFIYVRAKRLKNCLRRDLNAHAWTYPYKNQLRKLNTCRTIVRVIKPVVIYQNVSKTCYNNLSSELLGSVEYLLYR